MATTKIIPASIPPVLQEGGGLADESQFRNVQRASGHSRKRRVWTGAQRRYPVSWLLNDVQMQALHYFTHTTLKNGQEPFFVKVKNELGMQFVEVTWEAMYVANPRTARGGKLWKVVGAVIAAADAATSSSQPVVAPVLAAMYGSALEGTAIIVSAPVLSASYGSRLEQSALLRALYGSALDQIVPPILAASYGSALEAYRTIPLGVIYGSALEQAVVLFDSLAPIPNLSVLGNASGVSSSPYAILLTALLDAVFGTTTDSMLIRRAAGWTVLAPPATDGWVLTWDTTAGVRWEVPTGGGGGGAFTVGTSFPGSPAAGDRFFHSTTLRMYTYIDATSLWVQAY